MNNFLTKFFNHFKRKEKAQEGESSSVADEIKLVDVLSERSPFDEPYAADSADDPIDNSADPKDAPSLPIPTDKNESLETTSQEIPGQYTETSDISDLHNDNSIPEEGDSVSSLPDNIDNSVNIADPEKTPLAQEKSSPKKRSPLSSVGKMLVKVSRIFSKKSPIEKPIEEESPHLIDPLSELDKPLEQSLPLDNDHDISIAESPENKEENTDYKSDDHEFIEQIYRKNDTDIPDTTMQATADDLILEPVFNEDKDEIPNAAECEEHKEEQKKKEGLPLFNETIHKISDLINRKTPSDDEIEEEPLHLIDPLTEGKPDFINEETEPLEHVEEGPYLDTTPDDTPAEIGNDEGDDISQTEDVSDETRPVISADSSSADESPDVYQEEMAAIDEPLDFIKGQDSSTLSLLVPDNNIKEESPPVVAGAPEQESAPETPEPGQEEERPALQSEETSALKDPEEKATPQTESILEEETVSLDLQEKMASEKQQKIKASKDKKIKRSLPREDKEAFSLDCLQYLSFGKYFFVVARKKPPRTEKKDTDIEIKKKTPLEQFKESIPEEKKLNNRVFVIAGTKKEMNNECLEVLSKLGLEPILAHDQFDFSESTDRRYVQYPDVKFAIVILSGDDFVYPKNGKPADSWLRARQDIVFELGNLIGKLGRQNVFSLYYEQKSFLLPTSLHNASYTPFDKTGHWKSELVQRLRLAGFDIDKDIKM